jgi:ABC-type siderophore export system fused ATPase/permease subunit
MIIVGCVVTGPFSANAAIVRLAKAVDVNSDFLSMILFLWLVVGFVGWLILAAEFGGDAGHSVTVVVVVVVLVRIPLQDALLLLALLHKVTIGIRHVSGFIAFQKPNAVLQRLALLSDTKRIFPLNPQTLAVPQ